MPCADNLALNVADRSELRISEPNAFKQYSVPSDFAVGGSGRAAAADNLTSFVKNFRLEEIIPRRTTPEVRYLFAELGAGMPYRAASRVLKTCGFGDMGASHMAIRRHTLATGRELEAQRLDAAGGQAVRSPDAAQSLVVG